MTDIDLKLQSVLEDAADVIVWGTGQLAMKLLAETSLAKANIVAFVDGNPINQGSVIWFFGLCYAMDGGYNKCNPYIERHLAIFVNCSRSRTN
ncbi:hypothetical protein MiHa_04283 [Microcystis aeruginosa NIES-2522]|uniref:hypothetical protein n=1 Tax=Microcystis aeruginosa TaxID=1126 RepID=UPI0012515E5A|nr:hypothetical protein [Microcystis aeruginosa]GCA86292.1 hypothetical protein MiHa_04283 [Microcystis aeruginosa NIES-2522]